MKLIDLTGRRFGKLVVVSGQLPRKQPRYPNWLCRCDCGNTTVVLGDNLRSGNTQSCGCKRVMLHYTHGQTDTALHRIWRGMRDRCQSPRNKHYRYYGGRGITICARWQSFENFLADMGERPSPHHSIERTDNELGYFPENCRWATQREQTRNTRRNHWIEFNGERLLRADWARRLGISDGTMGHRLRDWPLERALTEPSHRITIARAAT